jgi:glucokinase
MLLAGDIGGTKTELAIFSPAAGTRRPLAQARFPSSSYSSLGPIVKEFLAASNIAVRRACFGVAGPVIGGRAKVTNLPWELAESSLAEELGLESVHLMNDLVAIALAIPLLQPAELAVLNDVPPVPDGAIAVIAPGTGLGEAFLTWDGSAYRAWPSEGGHAGFAPATPLQAGLLAYLMERQDHVSVERVCSGLGIPSLYHYLREIGQGPESPEMARRLETGGDRTRLISEAALLSSNPDGLSAATLSLFVSILAAEAGNLALKVLATGGVYLAGGIPAHILPLLQDGRFIEHFVRKGRLGELLRQMPVKVVLRRAALLGAARWGLELAGSR